MKSELHTNLRDSSSRSMLLQKPCSTRSVEDDKRDTGEKKAEQRLEGQPTCQLGLF